MFFACHPCIEYSYDFTVWSKWLEFADSTAFTTVVLV